MKQNPNEVYNEATRRGLRLIAQGDKLEVIPKSRLTPEFEAILREHKSELLALLETNEPDPPPLYGAWLHIAKQILLGEFEGADGAIVERLAFGLRHFSNPLCALALARLKHLKLDKR